MSDGRNSLEKPLTEGMSSSVEDDTRRGNTISKRVIFGENYARSTGQSESERSSSYGEGNNKSISSTISSDHGAAGTAAIGNVNIRGSDGLDASSV